MKNKWEEDFDNRFFNGDWDRFRRQDPYVIKIFIEETIQQALANDRKRIADEFKKGFTKDDGGMLLKKAGDIRSPLVFYNEILAIINKEE